jgi:pSer/pThr/pTyr-binding forkhead associated (FHA) protein
MSPIPPRGNFPLDPKLMGILKQISQDTGVAWEHLINLSVYELGRKLGYITPQSQSIPPPADIDILESSEPPPRAARQQPASAPERPAAKPVPAQKPSTIHGAGKQPQELLYLSVDNKSPVAVRKNVFLIGRGSKCDYVIEHRSVSREHAVVTRERSGWFIEDLNSANGTWLNGDQISKHKIEEGEEYLISNFTLRFSTRPS